MKDYFSHDYNSRNDKKLVKVFMKYGLEAIGAFWCIVEMLYEESGYLSLSEYERITFELRTSNELINHLIFESELFQNDGEKFWSETAIERLKKRAEKSEKARESIEKRWNKNKDTNVLQSNINRNTNKVKESKEKESKINNKYPLFFTDWLDYKKSRKETYKNDKSIEACYNHLMNLSNNDNSIAEKIVFQSMANNWAGLFELKESKKEQTQQTKPKFTVTAKNGTRMVFYVDTLDEAKKLYAKETGAMIEDIYDVYARN